VWETAEDGEEEGNLAEKKDGPLGWFQGEVSVVIGGEKTMHTDGGRKLELI